MTDKIIVLRANIMAQDSKSVAYRDEGGTLRKAPAARVTVVESMDDMPQDVNPAGSGAPESALPDVTDPAGVTEDAPPPSDKPPPAETAPVSTTKPKPSRKKTMATAQASTAAKKKAAPPKAKVAAKKVAKPRTEASGVRTIGGKAVDLSEYTKVKAPGGGTSFHNGDAVAEKLEGKSLEEVYIFAAKTLKEDVKVLNAKYKHLNVGMQRMALGNRLRKVLIAKEA